MGSAASSAAQARPGVQNSAGKPNRAMVRAGTDALPPLGPDRKWPGRAGSGPGARSGVRGRGSWRSWRRRAGGRRPSGRKVELGLARQATVPGARRPARGAGGGGIRGGAARPRGGRRRRPVTSRTPRGQRPGRAGPAGQGREEGGRKWQAPRGRGGRGRRRALAAWLRLPAGHSAGCFQLGSLCLRPRGCAALFQLPVIDWPACLGDARQTWPGRTRGGGGGRRGGSAGDGREHAGPGRQKTWKRGWIEQQIPLPRGPHRARGAPSRDTPRGLLPPSLSREAGALPAAPRRGPANFSRVRKAQVPGVPGREPGT